MPVPLESTEDCRFEMEVEIPAELVRDERRRLAASVQKTAKVPGFRQGKAPLFVLDREFDPGIRDELKERFIPRYLLEQVAKRDVQVASGPYLGTVQFAEDGSIRVQAEFEVFPKFEISEYRGLRIPSFDSEVTDEMLGSVLEKLRHEHASFQNLDPRPIKDGDVAVAKVRTCLADGTLVSDLKEAQFTVGSEQIAPEGSEALRGKVPGDTVSFEVTLPENDSTPDVSGKTVTHHIEITGLQRRELPDLDDEFARDVNADFDSLEELKLQLREQLESTLAEQAQEAEDSAVHQVLAESNPMNLPPKYLLGRCRESIRLFRERRGLGPDDELSDAHLRRLMAIECIHVNAEIVLDRIAMIEGISISEAELLAAVRRTAERLKMNMQDVYQSLSESGGLAELEAGERREKARALVLADAERYEAGEDEPPALTSEYDSDSDEESADSDEESAE